MATDTLMISSEEKSSGTEKQQGNEQDRIIYEDSKKKNERKITQEDRNQNDKSRTWEGRKKKQTERFQENYWNDGNNSKNEGYEKDNEERKDGEERKNTERETGKEHERKKVNYVYRTDYDVYKEGGQNMDPYKGVIDTGCPKTVAGRKWMDAYT